MVALVQLKATFRLQSNVAFDGPSNLQVLDRTSESNDHGSPRQGP